MKPAFLLLYFLLLAHSILQAQPAEKALRLFVDCSFCSLDYLRQHLHYIDYVRDRRQAELHLIGSRQPTATRAQEVLFEFIGREKFQGQADTLRFVLPVNATAGQENEAIKQKLEQGLLPFLAQTTFRKYLKVQYEEEASPLPESDPWKNWVFTLRANSRIQREDAFRSANLRSTATIRKVTPDIRIQFYKFLSLSESFFDTGEEEVRSISRELYSSNVIIKSIDAHWSYGGEVEFRSSFYQNLRFQNRYWLAVEYNLFPYSESSRRQLRIAPHLGYDFRMYNDPTIYDKTREGFLVANLLVGFDQREEWGQAYAYLEAASFLNALSFYELSLSAGLSLNLFQGFALEVDADGALVRNQANLPGAGLTKEEILTQQRQLATNFRLRASVGFSYTFGSIYNNVVNPRFGY